MYKRQDLFNHIVSLDSYNQFVSGLMLLAIIFLGLRLAAQINPPNIKDLFVMVAKLVIIYLVLKNWDVFQGLIVNFFESLANGLTEVFIASMLDEGSEPGQIQVAQLADQLFLKFFTGSFWNMVVAIFLHNIPCLLYTSPSPRDA